MADALTILRLLEEHFSSIQTHLAPDDWAEFSRRAAGLADRFNATDTTGELDEAVEDLLDLCAPYPYLADLLDIGSRRPSAPQKPEQFDIKEIANRYYSLLDQMQETPVETEDESDVQRTDS